MLNNIEKGDTVVIKDTEGFTKTVTVLSVKPDYNSGGFLRFDYIENNVPSPMRRTAYPKELISILRKTTVKALDPKSPRPGDDSKGPQNAIVVNGKVYVERGAGISPTVPLNPEAANASTVNKAISEPAKPVTERIKQHGPKAK